MQQEELKVVYENIKEHAYNLFENQFGVKKREPKPADD